MMSSSALPLSDGIGEAYRSPQHDCAIVKTSAPAHYNNFIRFHKQNPHVYETLRRMALKAKRSGLKKYGIKALYEVARWKLRFETNDALSDFKLNNNYPAFYARMLMENEPELNQFFETRNRRNTND